MFRSANPFGRRLLLLLAVALLGSGKIIVSAPAEEFAAGVDVGKVELPGSTTILSNKAGYRITGSGANIWAAKDAFHFAARKASGDLVFSTDVEWVGEGKAKHRKACAMVRQSLKADAPYADAAVHGDGLIALQYRQTKGGLTFGVQTPIKAPATIKLERDGNLFTLSVAPKGKPFQPVGAVTVELSDPVYAGLAVCSHNASESETAIFSNVKLETRVPLKGAKRVHEASLEIVSAETGERRIVHRAYDPFQAPNWTPDGKTLIAFVSYRLVLP